MINPVDYMSRLKMPAMMTDTEGGVIFANAAVTMKKKINL